MTALAYLLVAINCAIAFWLFERKRSANSPFQLLFLLIIAVILLPGFADVFAGTVSYHPLASPVYVSSDEMVSVHTTILMALLVFSIVEWFVPTMQQRSVRLDIALSARSLGAYKIVLILLVLSAPAGLLMFGLQTAANLSFEVLREGPIGGFSLWVFYLQLLLIGLPSYLFFVSNNKVGALLVLMLFVTLYLILGGSRQVPVFSIAAMIFIWLSDKDRKTSFLLLTIFVLWFSAIDVSLEALKLIRNATGLSERMAVISEILSGKVVLYLAARGESGVRYVMYVFMTDPAYARLGDLQYLGRTLLFWLPSFADVLDVKPEDFEVTMFERIFGSRIGTMHATVFGSAYADAGFFTFVWMLFLAAWMRAVEWALRKFSGVEHIMLWSTCIYSSSMVARGSLYAPVVISFLAVVLATLSMLYRRGVFRKEPYSSNIAA